MRNAKKLAVVASLAGTAGLASAAGTGPDFTALTGSIDFTTVGAAILVVAGLKVAPYVTAWGARVIMGFIKR